MTIRQPSQFSGSREHSALTVELAKILGLVAPVSMSADQQTLWLASAVDALEGIRASEVEVVSAEIRRSVTRTSQIVPEIARLVADRRRVETKQGDEEPESKAARLQAVCDQANAHAKSIGRTDIHWSVKNGETVAELR
jgi:hypothetical protein